MLTFSVVSCSFSLVSFSHQKYRITKRVGVGSFSDIYLGVGANGEKVHVRRRFRGFYRVEKFSRHAHFFSFMVRWQSSLKSMVHDAHSFVMNIKSIENCKMLLDSPRFIISALRIPTI